MKKLFTERHGGTKPRTSEVLNAATTKALLELVAARISEQWFGASFSERCSDGQANAGVDTLKMRAKMTAFDVVWPDEWMYREELPTDGQIFDLVEFAYEFISEPQSTSYHDYFRHYHYRYDQTSGRAKFESEVNRIFEYHGIAFELKSGEVTRMTPTGLHEVLEQATFNTGDKALDELLEDARHKLLNRDLKVRKESLEKLWDAWERLKTIGPGNNKTEQIRGLLDKAAPEMAFRERIEKEAKELTEIGNSFMIRHTETNKTPITDSAHVDYLFHRMFSIIRLLLHKNGLGG